MRVKSYLHYLETEVEMSEQFRVWKTGWNMTRKDRGTGQTDFSSFFLQEECRGETSLYFYQLQPWPTVEIIPVTLKENVDPILRRRIISQAKELVNTSIKDSSSDPWAIFSTTGSARAITAPSWWLLSSRQTRRIHKTKWSDVTWLHTRHMVFKNCPIIFIPL